MKFNSKVLASALLAAMGLIGIQTQATANDEHNFPRWGHGAIYRTCAPRRKGTRCPGKSTSGKTGSMTASCKACAAAASRKLSSLT